MVAVWSGVEGFCGPSEPISAGQVQPCTCGRCGKAFHRASFIKYFWPTSRVNGFRHPTSSTVNTAAMDDLYDE